MVELNIVTLRVKMAACQYTTGHAHVAIEIVVNSEHGVLMESRGQVHSIGSSFLLAHTP